MAVLRFDYKGRGPHDGAADLSGPRGAAISPAIHVAAASRCPARHAIDARKTVILPKSVARFALTPERAAWLFFAFAALVFLMGGGSRFDIESLAPLRAIAAVFLAVAVWFMTGERLRPFAAPIALIVLLAVWMGVQLVPLPPATWGALPGREAIAELGAQLGMADLWRPITFSPLRTWNSLASLIVPLAALCLVSLLDEAGWARARRFVFYVAIASALLGAAQLALPGSGGLFLYKVTNPGEAVGLFSNRNHHALFLNVGLLFGLFELDRVLGSRGRRGWPLVATGIAVLALMIVLNASRFGLLMMAVVLTGAAGYAMFRKDDRYGGAKSRTTRIALIGIVMVLGALLVATLAAQGRMPALERLLDQQFDADQRVGTLPYVTQLATDLLPLGAGFGAFEQAYRTVEPSELLSPHYLNQAHNDWLQLVVEGGLPGVILALLWILLIARWAFRAWRERGQPGTLTSGRGLGVLTLGMIALHSAVDYPLRTPSIMLVAVIAVGLLARRAPAVARPLPVA